MLYKFETNDDQEAKRLARSDDMFNALVQITENMHLAWQEGKAVLTLESLKGSIDEVLQDNYIDIEDLKDF